MAGWNGSSGNNGSDEESIAKILALLGALVAGAALCVVVLVAVVLSPAALFAAGGGAGGGGTGICSLSSATTPEAAEAATATVMPDSADCINPNGNAIVAVALQMATHLHGNPDVWYDASFPPAVIAYWEQTCPGCSEWQNGNLQCVMLALAAYGVAGVHPPAAGNAIAFWSLYANRAGWTEIPAAWAPAGQRGLPQPGDWIVWYSAFEPGVGHIAVVVQVTPPSGGQAGDVTFVEANGPGSLVTEPLLPDLTVQTWSGYAVVGYIRHV